MSVLFSIRQVAMLRACGILCLLLPGKASPEEKCEDCLRLRGEGSGARLGQPGSAAEPQRVQLLVVSLFFSLFIYLFIF